MQISDDELYQYNQMGLIPGPEESEGDFLKRVQLCLNLEKELEGTRREPEILSSAFEKAKNFYDIEPRWIPVLFSNAKLRLWHGGCVWIFQLRETTADAAFLQLRKNFRFSDCYLRLYKRNEIVVHELAHAGRMKFQEPKFEEILAYHSSESHFRRLFGPIVQSARESLLFVLFIAFIIFLDVTLIFLNQIELYYRLMWLKLILMGMVGLAGFRLWKRQRIFAKCLKNLKLAVSNPAMASAIIYRLRDFEIQFFANISPREIHSYSEKEKKKSLRWRLLNKFYFGEIKN